MNKYYSFRRIVFETESAMHVGSGESDPTQDMPIQLDVNDLPTINATSLTGILRHMYKGDEKSLFGDSETHGSRIFIENAAVLDEDGTPVEGILDKKSNYLERIQTLFQRDHCAIAHTGSGKRNGKFDRSVLIAGVRFICEFCIFAESMEKVKAEADDIVRLWMSPDFRIGGGTRNGFGKIKVIKVNGREYDLNEPSDLEKYLERSASFRSDPCEPELPVSATKQTPSYTYTLKPETFWLIASGSGRDDIDICPKLEQKIVWINDKPEFEEYTILPATSVKGALAHRTAYHYNKLKEHFADDLPLEDFDKPNPAVSALFGTAKGKDEKGRIGRIMISDIYGKKESETDFKVMNHVKIDRFTGGSLDGALFTEQVVYGGELNLEINILPPRGDEEPAMQQAFELALKDLLNARLPLGGGTMRGLGAMKNMEESK